MNYLITAAGKGSRLIKRGIKPPKPLVIVNGIELLIWSLSSFNFSSKDRLYIVTQKKDRVKECLLNKIKQFFPQISIDWLELEEVKNVAKLLPLGLPNSLTKSSSEETAVISPTGPFSKAPAIAPILVDTAGTTLVKSTSLTRTPGDT